MAPEVIEPRKFTKELRSGPHTDVFAFGVTIFLLFSGFHRPYKPDVPGHVVSSQVWFVLHLSVLGFAQDSFKYILLYLLTM